MGKNVDLNVELAEGCFVKGFQGQIFEVLVNLIKNAAEALREGGEISLSSSIREGESRLPRNRFRRGHSRGTYGSTLHAFFHHQIR